MEEIKSRIIGAIKPGRSTTEFKLTGAGMLLSALFALLAAFNVLTLTNEQKAAIYYFAGVAWMVLPSAYSFARSIVKAAAVKKSEPEMIIQNKQVGSEESK